MKKPGWLQIAGMVALMAAGAAVWFPVSGAEEAKAPTDKDKKEQQAAAKSKPAPAKAAPAKPAPAKPAEAKKPALDSGDGPVTITNEDLERMFGPPEETPAAAVTPAAGGEAAKKPDATEDPLKAMADEKQHAAERQERIATAQRALTDAEANLKNLEARQLATKNPYLPRPKMTEDEAKQQEGLDGAQRVEQNTKLIEDARAQVERLRAELAQAQSAH